ncbi:hypothetical protein TNCV_3621711 [Trichonephila clavipes]|nr:hypothetical protein TNCV_3621711 [Trichonephila clavipes]
MQLPKGQDSEFVVGIVDFRVRVLTSLKPFSVVELIHVLSIEYQSPHVGVAKKFEEWDEASQLLEKFIITKQ